MVASFTQWQQNQYPGPEPPFNPAQTYGPQPQGHDYLDTLRMSWRSTPEATYPDGYLGTINSRRQDRLLDGLKARANNRPYTRGVHKGERIEPRDYYWPPEFNLWSGLEAEAAGVRFVSPGIGESLPDDRLPTDGRVGMRSVPVGARYLDGGGPAAAPSAERRSALAAQAPPWSMGRANPGMTVPYPGR